ncbi:MAG: ABC transporter permease [Rhodospirillales bacterium]
MKVISEAWPELVAAIPVTLQLTGSALLLGLGLALVIALMRLSSHAVLRLPALGFVDLFRSTPLLVQFFLIYYGSGQFRPELQEIGLWTFFREPWFCAVFTLMLNTAAYTSEIIRGGIQSVGHGQIEAGRACGMSKIMLFRRIILPQAARQALPAYGNEIILMVKSSSLASTITILEITGVAKKIIAATFAPMSVFLIAGVIYLTINFIVVIAVQALEVRLSPQLHRNRRSLRSRFITFFGNPTEPQEKT